MSVRPLCPLQYMSNVDSWCKACGEADLPSELQDLEDGIHHHQGLYEHITATYSEVASRLDSHLLQDESFQARRWIIVFFNQQNCLKSGAFVPLRSCC